MIDSPQNLDQSDSHDPALRLASLPHRLEIVERIMSEIINDPIVSKYRQRAQFTFFCGAEPEVLGGYDGQLEVVGRCLEWFVFDYVIPDVKQTPAQYWRDHNFAHLSHQEQLHTDQCLQFILGLFEISAVKSGRGFVARDLLRAPHVYPIHEEWVSREVASGQLLLGRIFPHMSGYVLSGMAAVMSPNATREIKQLIEIGKLKPKYLLQELDGIELENLFGRTLKEIDRIAHLPHLHQRIKYYLNEINPGLLTFTDFCKMTDTADDPVDVGVRVCRQLDLQCCHEIEVIIAYTMACWFKTHRS